MYAPRQHLCSQLRCELLKNGLPHAAAALGAAAIAPPPSLRSLVAMYVPFAIFPHWSGLMGDEVGDDELEMVYAEAGVPVSPVKNPAKSVVLLPPPKGLPAPSPPPTAGGTALGEATEATGGGLVAAPPPTKRRQLFPTPWRRSRERDSGAASERASRRDDTAAPAGGGGAAGGAAEAGRLLATARAAPAGGSGAGASGLHGDEWWWCSGTSRGACSFSSARCVAAHASCAAETR